MMTSLIHAVQHECVCLCVALCAKERAVVDRFRVPHSQTEASDVRTVHHGVAKVHHDTGHVEEEGTGAHHTLPGTIRYDWSLWLVRPAWVACMG